MSSQRYDALVVGAGIGGVCTAARLVHAGYRTLLVERLDRVGGRASTEEVDGFLVNTGAAAVEFGGTLEEAANLVGAPLELRRPRKGVTMRLGKVTVNLAPMTTGPVNSSVRYLMKRELRKLPRLARKYGVPEDQVTVEQWLGKYTGNASAHSVLRNVVASLLAANADEVPAKVFLTCMAKGAFKDFGAHPEGTIGVPRAIVAGIERHGGEVWLSAEVRSLRIVDGRVSGAVIDRDGETVEIDCDVVVSNAGPKATVALAGATAHLPDDYVREIERVRACPMITVNFAAQQRFFDFDGAMVFANTRRLGSIVHFTGTCPERAPEGWYLYLGWSVPKPALADFDEQREIELTLQDLREKVPGFDTAKILSIKVLRDEWPAQRALSGFDPSFRTPIANLWNVGDGVKQYAEGGLEACTNIAKVVVAEIVSQDRNG